MNGTRKISPGMGREKHQLKPGKYAIPKLVAVLESLAADARSCSVRVHFSNGSSHNLDSPVALEAISDFREVRSVFLHVVYQDGSSISGRPINSPLRGYMVFDATPDATKGTKAARQRKAAEEKKRLQSGDVPSESISQQRGRDFKQHWQEVEDAVVPKAKRAVKYLTAASGLAFAFLAVAVVFAFIGALTLGLIPLEAQSESSSSKRLNAAERVLVYSIFFAEFSFLFHAAKAKTFLATRTFHPIIGPLISRFFGYAKRVFGSAQEHVPLLIVTFIATVVGGVLVLQIAKLIGLN